MVSFRKALENLALVVAGSALFFLGMELRGDLISMFLIVIGGMMVALGLLGVVMQLVYREPEFLDQYVEMPASEKLELSDMKQLYLQGSGMMRISNRIKKR